MRQDDAEAAAGGGLPPSFRLVQGHIDMTAATGQVLRRTGLVVELLCMFGLLSARQGKLASWGRLGVDPSTALGVGFGLGFVVWAVGTFAIYRARGERKRSSTQRWD